MADKQNTGIIRMDEEYGTTARIKVIGVGGAGGNAVNRMVRNGFTGVEFIAINTDKKALENSLADMKIGLGGELTRGLGAGARPEVGRQAILESREDVSRAIEGADMLFITAGMGGGTGTGAAPVVAEIAREMGILTVAVVTKPFLFEGPVRSRNAQAGVESICDIVDTIIVIQNQKLLSVTPRKMQLNDAFKIADDVLGNAVQGICDIILKHGQIQVDFADVKTVMERGGAALMGTGVAEGEGRATAAAERAIHSPLLDEIDISGATAVLVNVTHGSDFSLHELDEAMHYIYEAVGEDDQPNIIFGEVEDSSEDMVGKVSITVIATGFDGAQKVVAAPMAKTVVTPVVAPAPTPVAAPVVVTPVVASIAPTIVAPVVLQTVVAPAPVVVEEAPIIKEIASVVSASWKNVHEEELLRPKPFVAPIAEIRPPESVRTQVLSHSYEPSFEREENTSRNRSHADTMAMSRHESENDNLDVPAYLRNGM